MTDLDIRELERILAASGSQEDAGQLLIAYRRAGRELDYLLLLDQHGPRLHEHRRRVPNNRGGQSWFEPRLTPEQEQRLQVLMWGSLVESAIESDKTGMVDIPLLRVAEKFIDRNVHSCWTYNIYLDAVGGKNPNKDKEDCRPRYGSEARPMWGDADYLEKAKIYCTHDDEGVDLFNRVEYLEYWKDYPNHQLEEPWNNTKIWIRDSDSELSWWSRPRTQVDWDGTLENLGYVGGSNLTGIGFMYHHRDCSYDPHDDMDPHDPMNQPPPDTASLPPTGTLDPSWR